MGIADKLALVEVPQPDRSGWNDHGKYKYATRDDIFAVLRPALHKAGLGVMVSSRLVERVRHEDTRNGKGQWHVHVEVSITLVDSESDEEIKAVWAGEKVSSDDRAIQGAITQAVRSWATNTFMLIGVDEGTYVQTPDDDAPQVNREAGPQTRQATSLDELKQLISGLGFGPDEVTEYLRYVANTENCGRIESVAPARIDVWLTKMKTVSPDELKQRIGAKIGHQGQEAA
jgi:hypothetical protein